MHQRSEKIYSIAGKEFGEDEGKIIVLIKALYGLKSLGVAWHSYFASMLRDLGFMSCYADPDVWMRAAIKTINDLYYEYIFVYVDDLLQLSAKPMELIKALQEKPYDLKLEDVGPPKLYLGAKIGEFTIPARDIKTWCLSSELYLNKAISLIKE
jgi:hypothetical protein